MKLKNNNTFLSKNIVECLSLVKNDLIKTLVPIEEYLPSCDRDIKRVFKRANTPYNFVFVSSYSTRYIDDVLIALMNFEHKTNKPFIVSLKNLNFLKFKYFGVLRGHHEFIYFFKTDTLWEDGIQL
jgi:hypothetical protein